PLWLHAVRGPLWRPEPAAGAGAPRLSSVVGLPGVSSSSLELHAQAADRRLVPCVGPRERRRRAVRPALAHVDRAPLGRPRPRPARAGRGLARVLQARARVAWAVRVRRGLGGHARSRRPGPRPPARRGHLAAVRAVREGPDAVAPG